MKAQSLLALEAASLLVAMACGAHGGEAAYKEQYWPPQMSGGFVVADYDEIDKATGQEFVASMERLNLVELRVNNQTPNDERSSELLLKVRDGSINGSVIGISEVCAVPNSLGIGLVAFRFYRPVVGLKIGHKYVLEVVALRGQVGVFGWDSPDPRNSYVAGEPIFRGQPFRDESAWGPNFDLAFRTGWVEPSRVFRISGNLDAEVNGEEFKVDYLAEGDSVSGDLTVSLTGVPLSLLPTMGQAFFDITIGGIIIMPARDGALSLLDLSGGNYSRRKVGVYDTGDRIEQDVVVRRVSPSEMRVSGTFARGTMPVLPSTATTIVLSDYTDPVTQQNSNHVRVDSFREYWADLDGDGELEYHTLTGGVDFGYDGVGALPFAQEIVASGFRVSFDSTNRNVKWTLNRFMRPAQKSPDLKIVRNGAKVRIEWGGPGGLYRSRDLKKYDLVAKSGPLTIDLTSDEMEFFRVLEAKDDNGELVKITCTCCSGDGGCVQQLCSDPCPKR